MFEVNLANVIPVQSFTIPAAYKLQIHSFYLGQKYFWQNATGPILLKLQRPKGTTPGQHGGKCSNLTQRAPARAHRVF